MNVLTGKVAWVFGDCYDIDLICGVKNISVTNEETLKELAMKDYTPNFSGSVQAGDILVAGVAFGYGHPHPQGMKAMRAMGITTIVAKSFARVFFKNEIASGMQLFPCSELPDSVKTGDMLSIDIDAWTVTVLESGEVYPLDDIPPTEREMIKCRGIANYLQQRKNVATNS